jgi:hypothetical protein
MINTGLDVELGEEEAEFYASAKDAEPILDAKKFHALCAEIEQVEKLYEEGCISWGQFKTTTAVVRAEHLIFN